MNGKIFAYSLGLKDNENFFKVRNIADHLYQGSRAIHDEDVLTFINQFIQESLINLSNKDSLEIFEIEFYEWLQNSLNTIDLSQYEVDFSNGTTQAFDSFYFRHSDKNFKCLVGEYFYHLKTWSCNRANWSFINSVDDLSEGDAFVISVPFCDTGNVLFLEYILQHCDKVGVPVLIDCAYYPIADVGHISTNYDCIDTICFSLSKVFPVANYRIGMRYTKKDVYDGQKLHHDIKYNNTLGAAIGLGIIRQFPSDYIHKKYSNKQLQVAKFFDIEPSDTVIFGVGDSKWDQYSRRTLLDEYRLQFDDKMFVNRICLNSVYENWELFERVRNEV